MSKKNKINGVYLFLISLVSAFGGLLFGYDWVVIGGAKPFYEAYLGIENFPVLQGWAMSSALVGCILGVMTSGYYADRYGRKKLLILSAGLFIVSAVFTGLAENLTAFVIYRIIGGIGIGITSNISPIYIAEVVPAHIRGRYVSLNQLTIVLGILSAQITNWLLAEEIVPGTDILDTWNGQMGWRWMFWAENVPAVLFFVCMFFVPESPKWMVFNHRKEGALKLWKRIGGEQYAQEELRVTQENASQDSGKVPFLSLFKGKMKRVIWIGIILAAFQQWCGINVIFNYAQEIFTSAGYTISDMFFNIIVTGSANLIFTVIAIFTVDKLGRRALMRFGALSLTLIYLVMGCCYFFEIQGFLLLLLVVLAIACYAVSLGAVVWVILAEIFPTRVRGTAVAISTFALWAACFILTYTFPILNNSLGADGTFWLYGAICLAGYLFITFRLPETKQKSLEEIEKELLK